MAIEILWWAVAVNAVLFIRVLMAAPRVMKQSNEAEILRQQAALLWAEVEREKVTRGLTDADGNREMRLTNEAQLELFRLKNNMPAKESKP